MTVWRFIRKWWWTFLVGAGVVGGVLLAVFLGSKNEPEPDTPTPTYADKARQEIERIHLEAEVEKARVRAQADAQRTELDRIEAHGQEDPRAAREALSSWLTRNL